ncbi:hypothetical protein VTL71DRAFT_8798 [Oculimacula yallundae]|uniref:Metacaspase n=1 Tax=Oculimacula yallundae TaxID=86028 RepID=A0ABR4CYM2_9HELO
MTSLASNNTAGSSDNDTDDNASNTPPTPIKTTMPYPYKRVVALLCCWEDDEEGCWGELVRLQTVFEKSYHFETDLYPMPSQNPESSLLTKIEEIKEKVEDEETLVILYYGGHGAMRGKKEASFEWHCLGDYLTYIGDDEDHDRPLSQLRMRHDPNRFVSPVRWPVVEKALRSIQSDVLVLIDGCEASSALAQVKADGSSRRMDFIAACGGHDAGTPVPGKMTYQYRLGRTFTDMLIHVLEAKVEGQEAFTVADLHLSIVQRILEVKLETKRAPPTPLHFSVGAINGIISPNIQLQALKEKPGAIPGKNAANAAVLAEIAELANKMQELQAKVDTSGTGANNSI